MAEVTSVELKLERQGILHISLTVQFTLRFAPEEVAANKRFRVYVQLYGDDRGEGERWSLALWPIHTFQFGEWPFFRHDYAVVTATTDQISKSVNAVFSRDTLDEDPGTSEIVYEGRPQPDDEDGTIRSGIPRADEVYARVQLTTDTIATAQSATQTVPGSGGWGT